jgi:hypothetical protein
LRARRFSRCKKEIVMILKRFISLYPSTSIPKGKRTLVWWRKESIWENNIVGRFFWYNLRTVPFFYELPTLAPIRIKLPFPFILWFPIIPRLVLYLRTFCVNSQKSVFRYRLFV